MKIIISRNITIYDEIELEVTPEEYCRCHAGDKEILNKIKGQDNLEQICDKAIKVFKEFSYRPATEKDSKELRDFLLRKKIK